ncbi:unnamed protein product [Amoebophrya sp. A120]|nr:unnamed protein product [Amoebophrya sp. A120]|eukprot:GSA120T00024236001.1
MAFRPSAIQHRARLNCGSPSVGKGEATPLNCARLVHRSGPAPRLFRRRGHASRSPRPAWPLSAKNTGRGRTPERRARSGAALSLFSRRGGRGSFFCGPYAAALPLWPALLCYSSGGQGVRQSKPVARARWRAGPACSLSDRQRCAARLPFGLRGGPLWSLSRPWSWIMPMWH